MDRLAEGKGIKLTKVVFLTTVEGYNTILSRGHTLRSISIERSAPARYKWVPDELLSRDSDQLKALKGAMKERIGARSPNYRLTQRERASITGSAQVHPMPLYGNC